MGSWIKVPITVFTILAIFITGTSFVGEYRRKIEKAALLETLINESPPERILKGDYASLKDIPNPVQKYFRYVFSDGQSVIKTN